MWECLPRKKRRDPQGGESQSEAPPAFQRAEQYLYTSLIATRYEIISKEPLGPVVRRDDEEWLTLVKWVLYTLIEAEERGVTQAKVRTLLDTATDPGTRRFLASDTGLLQGMSQFLYKWFGTNLVLISLVILAVVGVSSSLLANIPVVAVMLLMVRTFCHRPSSVPETAMAPAFVDWPGNLLPVFVAMMFAGTLGRGTPPSSAPRPMW